MSAAEPSTDIWFEWLVHIRSGGDAAFGELVRTEVIEYVDRILDRAKIQPGMTLVDVGTGEGAVAFRAIERFGPTLRVVLTDISEPLLHRAQARAVELGVQDQCTFIACGADSLGSVATGSADVVMTRSALAYVRDKAGAMREFNRILKPGGQLSLGEPVFQDDAFQACVLKSLTETARNSPPDPLQPLLHRWKAAQFPDTPEGIAANPLTNFSERTLFDLARISGFSGVHVEFHIHEMPAGVTSWPIFLEMSPHPLAPTLADVLAEQFTEEERQIFEVAFRPLITSGRATTVLRMAFLSATKAPSQESNPTFSPPPLLD